MLVIINYLRFGLVFVSFYQRTKEWQERYQNWNKTSILEKEAVEKACSRNALPTVSLEWKIN